MGGVFPTLGVSKNPPDSSSIRPILYAAHLSPITTIQYIFSGVWKNRNRSAENLGQRIEIIFNSDLLSGTEMRTYPALPHIWLDFGDQIIPAKKLGKVSTRVYIYHTE